MQKNIIFLLYYNKYQILGYDFQTITEIL